MAALDFLAEETAAQSQEPVTPALRAQRKREWDSWMGEPSNASALVQFGLAMMQPIGVGQNFAGHLGSAVGQGLQAKDRHETTELNEELAVRKAQREDEKVDVLQHRADTAERRAESADLRATLGKGLTQNALFSASRRDKAAFAGEMRRQGREILKRIEDSRLLGTTPPELKRWEGKTSAQIASELAKDPAVVRNYKATLGEEDDDEVAAPASPMSPAAPAATAPSAPGAPPANVAGVIANAKAAIAKGAPRDAVIRRLQAAGIDTSGL